MAKQTHRPRDPNDEQVTAARPGVTRRALLQTAGMLSVAAVAARFGIGSIAHAQMTGGMNAAAAKRRFVFCYMSGGWDQLLFLDPRDPDVYNEDARGRLLTDTRYSQMEGQNGFQGRVVRAGNLTFGPAVEKPDSAAEMARPRLSQHSDKIAIVRGINMGTVAHEVGYRFFLTGKFPAGNTARGTSLSTEIAGQQNSQLSLPVLSVRTEAYNDHQPGKFNALQVNGIDDLRMVLDRSTGVERSEIEAALEQYAEAQQPCDVNVYDRRGLLTQMREANSGAVNVLRQKLARRFEFVSDPTVPGGADAMTRSEIEAIRARNATLRTLYGIPVGQSGTAGAQAALAAIAIKEQVAQCVTVNLGSGLDTHFRNNLDHGNAIYPMIMAVAALIEDLSRSDAPAELGGKWIDHTTVVVFSEFSRTPLMNQFGGRDHHIASSCMLAGAGIKGNTVIGASGEVGMSPGRFDIVNNQVSPTGQSINPEHIGATLLASAGLDPTVLREPVVTGLLRT